MSVGYNKRNKMILRQLIALGSFILLAAIALIASIYYYFEKRRMEGTILFILFVIVASIILENLFPVRY